MVKTYVSEGFAGRYVINKTNNVKDDDCYCGPGNINVSKNFHSFLRQLQYAAYKWQQIGDLKQCAYFLSVYRLDISSSTP